jgi:SSS family solute:Na+ symporter
MGSTTDNPMGVEWFGMVMGLGFVLSFGYWCTDFLVVQRAMAANSMSAARRTPLIAAIPKMLFPALVILPGMIAIAMHHSTPGGFLPMKDGAPDYNLTMPMLLGRYLPTGLLGIGFTALMASFMSGMAGNVTAFNTVWTYDIYQSIRRWLFKPWPHTITYPNGRQEEVVITRKEAPDTHFLWMGRFATVAGILLSIGCAYLASKYNNIMDMLQLVFGFVNAPLFATFMLGMFWKRANGDGAFYGLLGGMLGAAIFHGLAIPDGATPGIKGGWIAQEFHFHNGMGQNFYMALFAWTICFVLTIVVSLCTARNKTEEELKGLVYSLTPKLKATDEPWFKQPAILGIVILAVTVLLNIIFW